MILTGCVAFAQYVGAQRVETELLPQCWEQIAHKYAERRLLVAEACGALAPYLPLEMRSSLVLSMLQQMLEDERHEQVREAIVRSLGILYGFVNDREKYIQVFEKNKFYSNFYRFQVITTLYSGRKAVDEDVGGLIGGCGQCRHDSFPSDIRHVDSGDAKPRERSIPFTSQKTY